MALLSVAPDQVRMTRFTSQARRSSSDLRGKGHRQVRPNISVLDYLKRIDRYFACSESVHVAALVYLDRLAPAPGRATAVG